MGKNKILTTFQAAIFPGKRSEGEPESTFSGSSDQWQKYRTIRLPGFDGSQTLNLDNFWLEVFSNQPGSLIMPLVGLETIVKFSGTQQLKEPFTIVATLSYSVALLEGH